MSSVGKTRVLRSPCQSRGDIFLTFRVLNIESNPFVFENIENTLLHLFIPIKTMLDQSSGPFFPCIFHSLSTHFASVEHIAYSSSFTDIKIYFTYMWFKSALMYLFSHPTHGYIDTAVGLVDLGSHNIYFSVYHTMQWKATHRLNTDTQDRHTDEPLVNRHTTRPIPRDTDDCT